jgi:DNA-binding PadR family transcriptional regulator
VSSIRLFVLGSLSQRGAMHGHQLRLLAEEERVHLWTDISVGALYGAIKRLANEGLIGEVRVEREGSYPERQVFDITEAGRKALAELREAALRTTVMKHDPFDLAMTRLDPERLDRLPGEIEARLGTLRGNLAEQERMAALADPFLSVAERWTMSHRTDRIRSEIASHERLLTELPDIIADELARKAHGHD